jgi:hypothetical protein
MARLSLRPRAHEHSLNILDNLFSQCGAFDALLIHLFAFSDGYDVHCVCEISASNPTTPKKPS